MCNDPGCIERAEMQADTIRELINENDRLRGGIAGLRIQRTLQDKVVEFGGRTITASYASSYGASEHNAKVDALLKRRNV